MKVRFDGLRPHWDFGPEDFAGRAFQMVRALSPREKETLGAYIAEEVTLITLLSLEKWMKEKEIPAWLLVMLQEKEKGAGGYKGNYTLGAGVDIEDKNLRWVPPPSNDDRYGLLRNALTRLMDDVVADRDWELRYPAMQGGEWKEGKDRRPVTRYVFGTEPDLFFIDALVDPKNPPRFDDTFFENLPKGIVPNAIGKPRPLKQRFFEPNYPNQVRSLVPCMAIWLNDRTSISLPIRDPRMNIITINVHDSDRQAHRILPKTIIGQFAHMLTDGELAKSRISSIWDRVLLDESAGGVKEDRGNDHYDLDKTAEVKPIQAPENPFRKPAFTYPGCQALAEVLGRDEVLDSEDFSDIEMKKVLEACKKLNIKVNTLFMISLLGLVGFSPVAAVAPKAKTYQEEINRGGKTEKVTRHNRIEVATFGHGLYRKSRMLRMLSRWVRDSEREDGLDEFIDRNRGSAKNFLIEAQKAAQVYQDQLEMASESRGVVTYVALLAKNNRDILEKITKKVAGHMQAAMHPVAQFSSLGKKPEVGKGQLEWFFESAFSKTVGKTIGMMGNELVVGNFLDDTSLFFNSFINYATIDDLHVADKLLQYLPSNPKDEVTSWLIGIKNNRLLRATGPLSQSPATKRESINLSEVPVTINGIYYKNIFEAIHQAGGSAEKMTHLFKFQDRIAGLMSKQLSRPIPSDRQQFYTRVREQTAQFSHNLVLMAEATAYTLLCSSGHAQSEEAIVLGGTINYRKTKQREKAKKPKSEQL